jgi:hypothetical protein
VIAPGVDDHVVRLGHVTADALRARGACRMMVVHWRVEFPRSMALAAHCIAFDPKFLRVRLVAVAAGHAPAMHPALQP